MAKFSSCSGLNDDGSNGVFRWADDGSTSTYLKFCSVRASLGGAPNQSCVYAINWVNELRLKRCWDTAACSHKFYGICKVSTNFLSRTNK